MSTQQALWAIPTLLGEWWWIICGAMALPAAFIVFARSIMNHDVSPATICKFLHVCSLVAIAAVWLNSGWIPWALALNAFTGLLWALLPLWQRLWDRVVAPRRTAHYAHVRRHGLGD